MSPRARKAAGSAPRCSRRRRRRGRGFEIWVFRDNTRARSFYETHGCRVLRGTDGENEEGAPDVLYEWRPGS
jgi:hypothetical protein